MLDRPGSVFKWWLHNEVYYLRTRGFIDKFQFVEHMKLSVWTFVMGTEFDRK